MLKNNFITSLLCLSALVMPSISLATNAKACETNFEMITKLRHPAPGSYTVWDSLYGEGQQEEVFKSLLDGEGGGVIAVGEMRATSISPPKLMFVSFDKRGRFAWDRYHSIKGMEEVVKMLPLDNGYLVLANLGSSVGKSVWIGFFDKSGKITSKKVIADSRFDLSGNDIHSTTGGGYILAVTARHKVLSASGGSPLKNAALYILDRNAKELLSRSYVVGGSNEITGLSVSKGVGGKVEYNATGYIESSDGQKKGWILRLDKDILLIWQRELSRGLSAKINVVSDYKSKQIVAFGDVLPVSGGAVGTWLMMLDSVKGGLKWQRYYYGAVKSHNYSARSISVSDGGLISLMMMANIRDNVGNNSQKTKVNQPAKDVVRGTNVIPENMSYAHVISVDPRGITLSGDAYYHGQGLEVSQMVQGNQRRRLMAGYSIVPTRGVFKNSSKDHKNPIIEESDVVFIDLPDARLPEKTRAGLALLKKKLGGQFDEIPSSQFKPIRGEMANPRAAGEGVTKDGWVIVGDGPDVYMDPCTSVKDVLP